MLICCLGPLLVVIAAPALGLNKENAFLFFIPVMVLFCFMIMGKGGGCCGTRQQKDQEKEDEDNQKNSQKNCH